MFPPGISPLSRFSPVKFVMNKGYAVVGVKGNGPNGNDLCSCFKELLFLFFRNSCMVAQNKNRVLNLTGDFSEVLPIFPQIKQGTPPLKRSQKGIQIPPVRVQTPGVDLISCPAAFFRRAFWISEPLLLSSGLRYLRWSPSNRIIFPGSGSPRRSR